MEEVLYDSLMNRAQFLRGVYNSKKTQQQKVDKEVTGLKEDRDVLNKVEKVFKHLIDKLAKKDLTKMDQLVTYGLNNVFPDRNIRFKSELQERGKKIWIDLQTHYNDNLVDADSKSSIHVIESFILRLICILKTKRAPFLLLDETFAAVHNKNVANVSKLVAQLAAKLGMDILLVTHNPELAESGNSTYAISLVNNETKLEKIK